MMMVVVVVAVAMPTVASKVMSFVSYPFVVHSLTYCHQNKRKSLFEAQPTLRKPNLPLSRTGSSPYLMYSSSPTPIRLTRAAVIAHPYEFEISRCRTSHLARCFLPAQARIWYHFPCAVWFWQIEWIKWNRQSLVTPCACFSSFSGSSACWVVSEFL